MDNQKIDKWLRTVFFRPNEAGPVTLIQVKHLSPNSRLNEVASHEISDERGDDFVESIEGLVNELAGAIHTDAEGLGGMQRYLLLAFAKNRGDSPVSRLTLSHQANNEFESDEIESEPPTKTGLISQQMRHNEALIRNNVITQNQMFTVMQRTIHTLASQNEKLIEDRMRSAEVIEDLSSNRHARDLETKRMEASDRFKTQTAEKLMALLPAVVNRVSGKKLMQDEVDPKIMMLKDLANSFDEEQLIMLQQKLRPDQLIRLMELLKSVAEEEPKPNGNGNGNGGKNGGGTTGAAKNGSEPNVKNDKNDAQTETGTV